MDRDERGGALNLRPYARLLFVGAFFGFLVNKLIVRPLLSTANVPASLELLSYSIPNFFEAVMGVTLVAAGLTSARDRVALLRGVGDRAVYAVAAVLAGVYVVTQELGFHSIGGNNVVDSRDVAASVLGLALMTVLFLRYGLFERGVGTVVGSDA